MLGNVRFFLEKFEMAGTQKAQFQAFYGIGTVSKVKILSSVFRFFISLIQEVKKWELRISRFFESSGPTGKYGNLVKSSSI
jgi:hypothetical protein